MGKLKAEHRILALTSAITVMYKIKNFITAAHLCEEYLKYESEIGILSPETIEKYKKYRAAF